MLKPRPVTVLVLKSRWRLVHNWGAAALNTANHQIGTPRFLDMNRSQLGPLAKKTVQQLGWCPKPVRPGGGGYCARGA